MMSNTMTMDYIRNSIVELGLRTQERDGLLVSKKGTLQRWLIDLRPIFLRRDLLEQIALAFWERYRNHEPFQLAGMETAAIPLLTALLIYAPPCRGRVNGLIVRKERKTTGLGNAIEGLLSDEPVILVDDVMNSGYSIEKARSVIDAAGGRISEVFVVIDYQSNKGLAWRDQHSIPVRSLFTLEEFELSLRQDAHVPTQRYRQLWQTTVPGAFPFHVVPKSAPLLDGSRVYRGCDSGKMQAFDTATGQVLWEYQVHGVSPRRGIWSTPALHDGRLYFGAYNGVIYCLDAEDGSEIWTQSYGEWVGASPIVVPRHRLVYFGIEHERPWAKGSIGAFNIDTGERVWEHLIHKYQHGSPAYWQKGDLIIWGTADHEMAGIDAATGKIVWVFKTRRSVKYAPAIDEERGLVAFASFDKSIYVLDAQTGNKLGEWETGEICYTTPLFVGNRLFCGSGDRHLYVIDIERMELIKKIELFGRVYCSPRLLGDRVLVGTTGGRLYEIGVESLEVEGLLQLPDAITNAVAATEDGSRIFVSTYMNHLFSFERLKSTAKARPLALVKDKGDAAGRSSMLPAAAVAAADQSLRNFRCLARRVDIAALKQEVMRQPEMWSVDTSRQQKVAVQRETESIFLRSPKRDREDAATATENIHGCAESPWAAHFPTVMRWMEAFCQSLGGELGRALLAKLGPDGRVYRHVDQGDYYRIRDRYHLVVVSADGSPMECGAEQVVMREGELWWFNNKQAHESFNRSQQDRIHLIFDVLAAEFAVRTVDAA